MARQPESSPIRNMRSKTGRGSSTPCSASVGATEGGTTAFAAQAQGWAAIRASSACRAGGPMPGSATGVARLSKAGRTSQSCGACIRRARAAGSPSHSVSTLASASASPSNRRDSAGRNAARPGDSSRPLPGWFTIRTVPPRTASSSPVTPRAVAPSSSRGSRCRPSMRRSSTSTCCRPFSVLRNSAPPRTVRSPGSTSAQLISRERYMCSNHWRWLVPGVSSATVGLGRPGGASRWSESCQTSKNGRSGRTCRPRNASGSTRASIRRFSRA